MQILNIDDIKPLLAKLKEFKPSNDSYLEFNIYFDELVGASNWRLTIEKVGEYYHIKHDIGNWLPSVEGRTFDILVQKSVFVKEIDTAWKSLSELYL